jgi:drug/metabolite transporter (DMT)-like permease
MLLAALGFSLMGTSAKLLKGSFNAGQLVFYRNAIGLLFLSVSLIRYPPNQSGGKTGWLIFRGLMGTTALYSLLYCILHMPLGTAMTYNLTSAIFIALFSFLFFREYHGRIVLIAVLIGFAGMLMVYKPGMHLPWYYHIAGLISGVSSAIAYLTVGRLANYYDSRMIVLSFLVSGVILPVISMMLHYLGGIPENGLLVIDFRWPEGREWIYLFMLGSTALFGQFFVTKAYGADKAGVVSVFGYANIIFSVFLGLLLGDNFPDSLSLTGILFIIGSGVMISLEKRKSIRKI